MRIVIARHAKAEESSGPDADRRLVPEGQEQAKTLAGLLAATINKVDEIWTSPLARAFETAEIVAEQLKIKVKLESDLAIGGDIEGLAWKISQSKAHVLMVVGHQPDLGRLAALLLGVQSPITLKKSGVCILDTRDASKPVARAVATLNPGQYQEILDGKEYAPWMIRKQLL